MATGAVTFLTLVNFLPPNVLVTLVSASRDLHIGAGAAVGVGFAAGRVALSRMDTSPSTATPGGGTSVASSEPGGSVAAVATSTRSG